MAELTNDLVWSHSRARAFRACLRAYWFTYYGSWGGWSADAPPRTRAAYLQKKLTTRAMWTGTVVHGVAEQVLKDARAGTLRTPDDVRTTAVARARREIADSASGAWMQRPARRTGFAEHYYGIEGAPEAWEEAIAEIDRQVGVLYAHKVFRRLLQVPERIRQVEELQRFHVDGTDVYVVLDVLVEDGRGGVVIIDWKTGGAHDDDEIAAQLGVYGLYVTRELGVADDRIIAMHVNLRHDAERRHPVGAHEIEVARAEIASSLRAMQERLVDVPENVAREEDHPPLPDGDARCRHCTFRRVCGRE